MTGVQTCALPIYVGFDAHAAIFEPVRVLELTDALMEYGPWFMEEPIRMENRHEMGRLREKMPCAVATGECLYTKFELWELVREGGVDILQPDVTKCGGLSEVRKIAWQAYDHHIQLVSHGWNTAVGVALAGNMIAVGIVSLKAVFGDFVGWSEALAGFITFAVIGFVLLYVVRQIVDFVLFPRVSVAHELAVDRNVGVAFIMAGSVISVSTILFFAV